MREATVTALEMRKKFGGILDRVAKKGEHITIVRGHLPLATMIPATEHQASCIEKDRPIRIDDDRAYAKLEKWRKKHAKELKRLEGTDSTGLIRKMRRERYGRR